jgi:hypothetical protein
MYSSPLAYFITFRTYGSWLHGDARGSVDRAHNEFGSPLLPCSQPLQQFETHELLHRPVELTDTQRSVIDAAVRDVCRHKTWPLHALNVRTNHVHVVVSTGGAPETAMNAFKAWATRRLREARLSSPRQRVWSRHGSTIYLFRPENLAEKIAYVLNGQ